MVLIFGTWVWYSHGHGRLNIVPVALIRLGAVGPSLPRRIYHSRKSKEL